MEPRMMLFLSLLLFPVDSPAALRPGDVRATFRQDFDTGRRSPRETCFIPEHLPGARYSARDGRHERELCGYDVDVNVAACPKTNSTNPGVNFFLPPPG